jgi:SAM-dependent methyltransferase
MSKIPYDLVKDKLARLMRLFPWVRGAFFTVLNLLFLRSWHIRRVIRTLERDREPGTWRILDAGCGFGQYDHFLLNSFEHVEILAVDVKEDYLRDCREYFSKQIETGRIVFEKADLRTLENRDSFDLILCIDVLEHIEEDVEVIRNLTALLKEGGYFLMHSPSALSSRDAGEGEESFVEEHARSGYMKEEIKGKLESAGLVVEASEYTYGKSGHVSWKISVKWPMLLFRKIGLFALPILFVYYSLLLPLILIMNGIDLFTVKTSGFGIWALGRK